jgi:phage host-nuclease inhibitor protein Gam
MGRPKNASATLESLQECEATMADLRDARTAIARLTAARDGAVNEAIGRYAEKIDAEREWEQELRTRLCVYYMTHLAQIETEGKRTLHLVAGVMGRRLGPPKLTPLNRNWSWNAIQTALRERFGARFLRAADPEIDKEALKRDLVPEQLHQVGLKLVQDEKFFAEPAEMPDPAEAAG